MVLWQPQTNSNEPYKKQTLVQILKDIFELSFDGGCVQIFDSIHGNIKSDTNRIGRDRLGGLQLGTRDSVLCPDPMKRGVRVGKPPDAPIQFSSHFVNSC